MSCMTQSQLTAEILRRNAIANECRHREFMSARRIQSTWRGYSARKHLKRLHRMATIIQTTYRNYYARRQQFLLLEEQLQQRIDRYWFDRAATIQRHWRGHHSRRTRYDHYAMKAWLRSVADKSNELADESWHYFAEERERAAAEENEMARKICMLIARKLHHFLRTRSQAGVLSRKPGRDQNHQLKTSTARTRIERLLASFRFRDFEGTTNVDRTAERQKYLDERDKLYARTAAGSSRYVRCDAHYRWRDVDAIDRNAGGDVRKRPATLGGKNTPFGGILLVRPDAYERRMLGAEKYCDKIMALTREYEILAPGRDFCLNTRIAERPERIEAFVTVLHDYCLLHNLVEK